MSETTLEEVQQKTWLENAEERLLLAATTFSVVRRLIDSKENKVYGAAHGSGVLLWPLNEGEKEAAATMRRVYGILQANGWKVESKKEKQYDGSEVMRVYADKGEMHVEMHGWMAKTCRIVEEDVVIPAEPAKAATPERVEKRRRIVCKNE